jgi:F0F1-type ATP synthase membrane subunit b/b'
MDNFLDIFSKVFNTVIVVLGYITFVILVIYIVYKIFEKSIMKRRVKIYAKKLAESNFLQEATAEMTDEEREKLIKTNHAETKIKLDLNTMQKTSETK